MEEKKQVEQQGEQSGGRRRRHRHKSSGGQTSNASQTAQSNAQQSVQSSQNVQKQNNQNGQNKPKNRQNAGKQNAPKQGNKQNTPKNQGKERPVQQKKEENRKDTYAYTLDGNLYINLTNKCSNGCDFCVRNEKSSYYGNYLWLRHGDPAAEKVIAAVKGMGDLTRFKEVVFCGFGEPTYKMSEMLALCDYFHEKGLKTRLNTNGQGNLINKRDVTPELKGKIDFVNISLNASCVEKYQPICRSQFGEAGFSGLLEFAKLCRKNGVACRFSIVDCIGEEEIEACKRLAESVKIPLYVRKYITDS